MIYIPKEIAKKMDEEIKWYDEDGNFLPDTPEYIKTYAKETSKYISREMKKEDELAFS